MKSKAWKDNNTLFKEDLDQIEDPSKVTSFKVIYTGKQRWYGGYGSSSLIDHSKYFDVGDNQSPEEAYELAKSFYERVLKKWSEPYKNTDQVPNYIKEGGAEIRVIIGRKEEVKIDATPYYIN